MGESEDEKSKEEGTKRTKAKSSSKPAKQEDKEAAELQRKAELESKIRERVATEARAFDVVNRLIEQNITSEYLLQACQFIDHSHYQDIVEERSINHLCGYPLCDNALLQVAKKKYHISTKSNTVYDITVRKKFCSNRCYHCSEHLRKQIPQTPVWTRRGEDPACFELLQYDARRPMEGEKVIGSHLLSLKEEVEVLKKLDRMEEKSAGRTGKTRREDPEQVRASFEESQRLSEELLSLTTEEDLLGKGMQRLSLQPHPADGKPEKKATPGKKKRSKKTESADKREPLDERKPSEEKKSSDKSTAAMQSSDALSTSSDAPRTCSRSKDAEREEKTQHGADSVRTSHDEEQKDVGEKVASTVSSGLESSMKKLTLQDNGDVNGIDSDDDCADTSVTDGDVGVSEVKPSGDLGHRQDSSASTPTEQAQPQPAGIDSDDDGDDLDGGESVGRATESDSLSKTQDSGISKMCTDSSQVSNTDGKGGDAGFVQAECPEKEERPKESALRQQPGESKAAYVMRLLDRHRNLLSKVADVQSNLSPSTSETTESRGSGTDSNTRVDSKADKVISPVSVSSGTDDNTRVDSKADKVISPDSNRKEDQQDSSEQLKQGKEKANHPSRKKKSLQTGNKPAARTAAKQAETSPLSAICQVISTWVSAETLDFLGLNSKSVPGEGKKEEDGSGESGSKFLKDPEMQQKYQDLCQRLAGQERDFDAVLGEDDLEVDRERRGGKKPLPNFEELKKETEVYQLRVQQFMAGSMTIKSKPTKKAKADAEDGEKAERPIMLPVIDCHNQLLIRRRIVLERLDHTMPSLLPPLGLSVQAISASLRELVFTFSLTSHNIIFKPAEWTLAAILLLKILEVRCPAVRAVLQCPERSGALSLVLGRLGHSPASLDHLLHDMLTQRAHALTAQGASHSQPDMAERQVDVGERQVDVGERQPNITESDLAD